MLWTEQAMAQRLNYEKRHFDHKRKINIHDESEFRQRDLAARWLKATEQRNAYQGNKTKPKPKPASVKAKKPIKYYKTFEQMPADDPHAQLSGTDMSRPPWE
jgi:hypothetical protein